MCVGPFPLHPLDFWVWQRSESVCTSANLPCICTESVQTDLMGFVATISHPPPARPRVVIRYINKGRWEKKWCKKKLPFQENKVRGLRFVLVFSESSSPHSSFAFSVLSPHLTVRLWIWIGEKCYRANRCVCGSVFIFKWLYLSLTGLVWNARSGFLIKVHSGEFSSVSQVIWGKIGPESSMCVVYFVHRS